MKIEFLINSRFDDSIPNEQNLLLEQPFEDDESKLVKKNMFPRAHANDADISKNDRHVLDQIKQMNLEDFVRDQIQSQFDTQRPIVDLDKNEKEQILNLIKVLNLEDLVRNEVKHQRFNNGVYDYDSDDDKEHIINLLTALNLEDAIRAELKAYDDKLRAVREKEREDIEKERQIVDLIEGIETIDEDIYNTALQNNDKNGSNDFLVIEKNGPVDIITEIPTTFIDSTEELTSSEEPTSSEEFFNREQSTISEVLFNSEKPTSSEDMSSTEESISTEKAFSSEKSTTYEKDSDTEESTTYDEDFDTEESITAEETSSTEKLPEKKSDINNQDIDINGN